MKYFNISYKKYILVTLLFLSSFSRLTFLGFDAIVVPLILIFFSLFGSTKNKLTYILLLLFSTIDNGGSIYYETPSLIRYFVYFYILITVITDSSFKIKKKYFPYVIYLISIPVFLTITVQFFDFTTFRQNIFLLSVFILIFLSKKKYYQIDFGIISYCMIAYIIGEYFGMIIFDYSLSNGEYLNYDSLKCLIILPSIYFLYRNKKYIGLALILLTIPILIQYGTRLILIMYLFILLMILLKQNNPSFIKFSITLTILIVGSYLFILFVEQNLLLFESTKVGSIFYYLVTEKNINYLELLDPIRYNEFKMFFDRPILYILFGEGLGSGLYDSNGFLSFVTYEMTSFKSSELSSGIFFGFHDVIIDVGLRFGLIFVVLIIFNDLYKWFYNNNFNALISMLFFVVSLYSSVGILSFLIINFFTSSEKNIDTAK